MLLTPLHLSTRLCRKDKREKTWKLQTKQHCFRYLRSIAKESTFTLPSFFKGLGYVKPITMDSCKNTACVATLWLRVQTAILAAYWRFRMPCHASKEWNRKSIKCSVEGMRVVTGRTTRQFIYYRINPRSHLTKGHAVVQLVEELRYKPEGRGFSGGHWGFFVDLILSAAMCPWNLPGL